MNINISDIVSPYWHLTWGQNPGRWISDTAGGDKRAEVLFRSFVNEKVPRALNLIIRLIDTRHISPVHLPMSLYTIFLIYVNEQIELYQSQREERDLQADQKWQEFQELFAEERHHLLTRDTKWAARFFEDLKNLLLSADVLAPDFDTTVSLWLQIISITHIGDMYLISIFEKKAKCTSLKKKSMVESNLPRGNLEASFYLIHRQLSKNYPWVTQKMAQLLPLPESAQLVNIFDVMANKSLPQVVAAASNIQNDFRVLVHDFLSLDLTDNAALTIFLNKRRPILVTMVERFGDAYTYIDGIEKNGKRLTAVRNTESGEQIALPKEMLSPLLSLLKDYQECHLLMDCYLYTPCTELFRILEALQKSNTAIEKYRKDGIPPLLISKCPSLLPTPSLELYDEKVCRELYTSSSPNPKPRRKKTGANTKVSIAEPTPKKTNGTSKQEKVACQALPQNPIVIALDPLEELREKIFKLHHTNSSVAMRQALWHADALISVQQFIEAPSLKAEESLTLLNVTASSAHKLLEQIYRSRMELRGTFQITHNLKEYHLALEGPAYPDIVKQLYLANHWTRYFYVEQERWHSLSTQVVRIPSLVEDLVTIAEGTLPTKNQLKERVKEIIEKTHLQAKTLLLKIKIPNSDAFLAPDVPLQLKTQMHPDVFDEVKGSLSTFLSKAAFPYHHPIYLHVKQGISALSILKGSLQKIQAAKNPRELATWTSVCLQQLQEAMENVLHAIEFMKEGEVSILHELNALAGKVGLEMGPLGNACYSLSYKTRYPAENLSDELGAQILDDVETLRQFPECLDGFKLAGSPKILWKTPNENISPDAVMARLMELIESAEAFLRTQALPALCQALYTQETSKIGL